MSTTRHYNTYENPTQLSKAQLWLIATSAMLTQLNNEFHDTLLPHHIFGTPELLESSKQSLMRDWEIKDLADLSDTLHYLHRERTFAPAQNNWEFLSEPEFERIQQQRDLMPEFANVMDMVRNYQFELNNSDYAWHYGRCSWIIRHAFYSGFITEEESWNLLHENGKRIKDMFKSWEEFALSYLAGAQYWKRNEYNAVSIKVFKDNITYLLTNQNSPWLQVNWNDYE
jgi:hypothetical protein